MIKTIAASELSIGMMIGFCKVRQIVALRRVTNGTVYARYETLGLFGKTVTFNPKQKISVKI